MFSHEASHWKEFELNGNDDFTHVFIEKVNPIFILIIQLLVIISTGNKLKENTNNTLKKRLQHYKDEIQKLKNESYATIISSVISFLLYAVKHALVFSFKVFMVTIIGFFFAAFFVTVASDKRLVDDIIRGIIFFLLYSAQLVLSDDSIISIILLAQPLMKLVFLYVIILNRIITFPHSSVKWVFSCVLLLTHCFIPKFPGLLFLSAFLCGTSTLLQLVFQKLKLFNLQEQLNIDQQNATVDKQEVIKVQEQLNTDQQNATVEKQEVIKVQEQLNIDQQNATVDKPEVIKVQEQLNIDQQNAMVDNQEFIKVKEQLNTDQQNATVDKHEVIDVQEQLNTDQQNATIDKQEVINVQEQLNTDQQNATVDKQELIDVQEQLNIDQQNATVEKQEFINVQEQLNTDQQNAKVDKQELINVQEQLNTDQQNAKVDNQELINVQEQLNTDQQNATVDKQEFINVQEELNIDQQNAMVDKQEFINVQEQLNTDQQNAKVDKQEFINVQEEFNIDQQNATVDKQEVIKVQEQLNTDQQNATIDKQELINVQEQLNTDQQNATVDNQELINVQEQLNTDQQNATVDKQAPNDEQRQLQIQTLKDEYRQQLQRKGHICAKNCVLCTILWSCQQKLGFYLCGPQLILTMLFHAAEQIEREYLKCEKNLEIFMKCEVIDAPVGCEYLWSDEVSKKSEMIEKAWNALMNMDKGVCLMGIRSSEALGGGHCVVFDTRTVDGTVIFHDPQREEEAKWSKTNFIDCLNDPDIGGIRLFPLNLQKLKEIIDEYSEILHHTGKSNQTLAVMPL
jgi:hypothetical protein